MKIITQWAAVAAVIAASTSAYADEVPLADSYGTLMACILGLDGNNADPADDSVAYVAPSRAQGWEWSCEYQSVKNVGDHKWKATGKCAAEGEESSPQMEIAEDLGKSVTITISDADAWDFTMKLPACSLSYAEQVELESMRLKALHR